MRLREEIRSILVKLAIFVIVITLLMMIISCTTLSAEKMNNSDCERYQPIIISEENVVCLKDNEKKQIIDHNKIWINECLR